MCKDDDGVLPGLPTPSPTPQTPQPTPDTTSPQATIDPSTSSYICEAQDIVITFNEAIDTSNLALSGDLSGEAQTNWNGDNTVLTLSPSSNWSAGENKSLGIIVQDLDANSLTLNLTYNINEDYGIVVTPSSPFGPEQISSVRGIKVIFDLPMDQNLSISGELVDDWLTDVDQVWNAEHTILTLTPVIEWKSGAASLNLSLTDDCGNQLDSVTQYEVHALPSYTITPPSGSTINEDQTITIEFSNFVNYLEGSSSTIFSDWENDVTVNNLGTTYELSPTSGAWNQVTDGTISITFVDGYNGSKSFDIQYTVTTGIPSITDIFPTNFIGASTSVVVTFNESMDTGTLSFVDTNPNGMVDNPGNSGDYSVTWFNPSGPDTQVSIAPNDVDSEWNEGTGKVLEFTIQGTVNTGTLTVRIPYTVDKTDPSPPAVTVDDPVAPAGTISKPDDPLNGFYLTVEVTGEPYASATVTPVGGLFVQSFDLDATGTGSCQYFVNGSYYNPLSFNAIQSDRAGNSSLVQSTGNYVVDFVTPSGASIININYDTATPGSESLSFDIDLDDSPSAGIEAAVGDAFEYEIISMVNGSIVASGSGTLTAPEPHEIISADVSSANGNTLKLILTITDTAINNKTYPEEIISAPDYPQIIITYPSADGCINLTDTNVEGTTSDSDDNVVDVKVSFDGGSNWYDATDTGTNYDTWELDYSVITTQPADGSINILARAEDQAGHYGYYIIPAIQDTVAEEPFLVSFYDGGDDDDIMESMSDINNAYMIVSGEPDSNLMTRIIYSDNVPSPMGFVANPIDSTGQSITPGFIFQMLYGMNFNADFAFKVEYYLQDCAGNESSPHKYSDWMIYDLDTSPIGTETPASGSNIDASGASAQVVVEFSETMDINSMSTDITVDGSAFSDYNIVWDFGMGGIWNGRIYINPNSSWGSSGDVVEIDISIQDDNGNSVSINGGNPLSYTLN